MTSNYLSNSNYRLTDYALASIVCLLATAYLLYEFLLQVAPAVMTHELMRDLNIDAAGLSMISAFYYLAYTPMQIPAGLLFDRFGPRLLLTLAALICALGAWAFGFADGIPLAIVGRFLMGFASAFAFIGALVLIARWFPTRYFALLTGVVQLMACIGAIAGEAPLAMAIDQAGWREVMMIVGGLGLGLAGLIFLIVRNYPQKNPDGLSTASPQELPTKTMSEYQRLKYVCKIRQNWWVALYALFSWWPITLFPALWGVPFLMTLYGINPAQAALAVSMVWIGIGIGSPLAGALSDSLHRRVIVLGTCGFLGLITTGVMLYCPNISVNLMYLLLFLFGCASSGQALSFALVKDNNPANVVGTAIGFTNMAVVLGGIFQFVVGLLLRYTWEGQSLAGVPVYHLHSYQIGLSILPISYGICWILSLFALKESYCKPTYNKALGE